MNRTSLAFILALVAGVGVEGQESPSGKTEAPQRISISWKNGKTTFDLGKAHLELSNRLQIRFTLLDDQQNPTTGSFRIRRFKTKLEGWAYRKDLTFEMQLNWAEDKPLEDANVAYDFSHGKKLLVVKAGQFKVPFGRQALISSGNLLFVDRSIATDRGARLRDIGLQLSGEPWGQKLDWRIAAFNGAGRNVTTNDNAKLQYNARITVQPWGQVAYAEGDLERTATPKMAVAVQYEHNDRRSPAFPARSKSEAVGADLVVLWRGFYGFAYGFREQQSPASGPHVTTRALAVDAGYLIPESRWQVAARWVVVDPSDRASGDLRTEKGIALDYLINRDANKLQVDLRRLADGRAKTQAWELRVQYQLIF